MRNFFIKVTTNDMRDIYLHTRQDPCLEAMTPGSFYGYYEPGVEFLLTSSMACRWVAYLADGEGRKALQSILDFEASNANFDLDAARVTGICLCEKENRE